MSCTAEVTAALVEKTHRSWDELELLDDFRRKLLLGYKVPEPPIKAEGNIYEQLRNFQKSIGK